MLPVTMDVPNSTRTEILQISTLRVGKISVIMTTNCCKEIRCKQCPVLKQIVYTPDLLLRRFCTPNLFTTTFAFDRQQSSFAQPKGFASQENVNVSVSRLIQCSVLSCPIWCCPTLSCLCCLLLCLSKEHCKARCCCVWILSVAVHSGRTKTVLMRQAWSREQHRILLQTRQCLCQELPSYIQQTLCSISPHSLLCPACSLSLTPIPSLSSPPFFVQSRLVCFGVSIKGVDERARQQKG